MSAKRTKQKKGRPEEKTMKLNERSATAVYYGFTPKDIRVADTATLAKLKKSLELDPKKTSEITQDFDETVNLEEKISLIHKLIDEETNISHPLMFYYGKKNTEKLVRAGLEIVGSNKSVAEATLIKTAIEMLRQEGYENLFVEINSVGDKDSLARLTRELTAYYRKHINDLPAECRQLLKKDVFDVLLYPHEKCILLREDAPKPMNYLSEVSREHFREVLEFLERMDIPYQIVSSLVGNRKYVSHVVFEIKSGETGDQKAEVLARGIRYNGIAKKFGSRKDIPAVGVALSFKPLNGNRSETLVTVKKPRIYFIQLGFEAKLKSLKVIEMLRQEKIALQQSLSRDKLTVQLATAENMKIPYVLIMGQREALEDSVIVRTMTNRSQETIKIDRLSEHLKKLK